MRRYEAHLLMACREALEEIRDITEEIREMEGGMLLSFYILIASWGNDVFAYLVGRKIGKHKFSPKVSPNKSVEGFVGGIIGAALLGFLFGYAFDAYFKTFASNTTELKSSIEFNYGTMGSFDPIQNPNRVNFLKGLVTITSNFELIHELNEIYADIAKRRSEYYKTIDCFH